MSGLNVPYQSQQLILSVPYCNSVETFRLLPALLENLLELWAFLSTVLPSPGEKIYSADMNMLGLIHYL